MRLTLAAVLGAAALSGCTGLGGAAMSPPQAGPGPVVAAPPPVSGPPRIAVLLPLTGPNAAVGMAMKNAASLVFSAPGSPPADYLDTGGDPARAAALAGQAIASGAKLIAGPLTAQETQAVAAVSAPAGVPVLAFTSDPQAASPGIWTLGITPGQQVRRLVAAAREDGRQRIAALLPDGVFGDALAAALSDAAAAEGMPAPEIRRGGEDQASIDSALRDLSQFDSRRGANAAQIRQLRESGDPDSQQQAAALAAEPAPALPFDALLLGQVGPSLAAVAEALPNYDIASPSVRVLGPALWAREAGRLGKLAGAWYASIDPASRAAFAQKYLATYGAPPPAFADLAVDAAAIARTLAREGNITPEALTRDTGFSGVDGLILLRPDGHVGRALAVFEIERGGGARIVKPAPETPEASGV